MIFKQLKVNNFWNNFLNIIVLDNIKALFPSSSNGRWDRTH